MAQGPIRDRDAIGPSLPKEVPPEVASWLDENPPRRVSRKPPLETVAGVGFGVWGVVEAAIFVMALAVGGTALLPWTTSPLLLPWVAVLALAAVGAWLSFWLASEYGWGVTTEWRT